MCSIPSVCYVLKKRCTGLCTLLFVSFQQYSRWLAHNASSHEPSNEVSACYVMALPHLPQHPGLLIHRYESRKVKSTGSVKSVHVFPFVTNFPLVAHRMEILLTQVDDSPDKLDSRASIEIPTAEASPTKQDVDGQVCFQLLCLSCDSWIPKDHGK